MSRDLHCKYCGQYTGTIRDAKLMKELKIETTCPSCLTFKEPVYTKPTAKPDLPDCFKGLFK